MTEEVTVLTHAAEIKGEQGGTGAGVVFLHAGVADRRMWRRQLTALQGSYHVCAYDRRGFGETRCEDEAFAHVEDLAALLNYLEVETATLVGSSQGGRVALDFALAYPQRVTSLVLASPAISGAPAPTELPEESEAVIEELEQAEAAGDLERVNALEAQLWLDGPTSAERRVSGAVRDLFLDMNGVALHAPELSQEKEPSPAYDKLSQVTTPTLVLWGDLDFPHVKARCSHLLDALPNASAKEISGTAHLSNLEQPAAFNAALLAFLGKQRPKRNRERWRPRV